MTIFKCVSQDVMQPSSLSNTERNLTPTSGHSEFLPTRITQPPLIYILSPWIYLLWTFHINEIIQYVVFGVCILSDSVKLSAFTQVVTCNSVSFLFHSGITFHCMDGQIWFIHSSVGGHLHYFHFFGYYE